MRAKLSELVEAGELTSLGHDYFEDLGGHVINSNNEEMIDAYFDGYLDSLNAEERNEVLERMKESE